ncbi:hypothetical protein E2C01_033985 [Portunus trituberculatus]|uniref:Uncharacterized protein n=1 Tax=Portunus trituberculatus TaxID=210409 RepID=A0A5B7F4E6_PORTR|nr:hypothetical protein [Portunus trituberculatus]
MVQLYLVYIQPRSPTIQEVKRSRWDATERLTSDLYKISNFGEKTLRSVQCPKNTTTQAINST